MKEEPNNKCREQGLVHAWQDITPNIVYATNPPQFPNKQEQCMNCGLIREHKEAVEKWIEYREDEVPKQPETTFIDLTDISVGGGTTTVDKLKTE